MGLSCSTIEWVVQYNIGMWRSKTRSRFTLSKVPEQALSTNQPQHLILQIAFPFTNCTLSRLCLSDMQQYWLFLEASSSKMPKIIGQTPSWLSQPSPGARIFSDPEAQAPASPSKRQVASRTTIEVSSPTIPGKKLIAHRGTEIFTVIGNKIRWADLARVKDAWEEQSHRKKPFTDTKQDKVYRVCACGNAIGPLLTLCRPSKLLCTMRSRTLLSRHQATS